MYLAHERSLRVVVGQGGRSDAACSEVGPRALSIRQPWAWAILHGGKRVENRTWYTSYRGPIYLHAALRVDYDAIEGLFEVISSVDPRPPAYRGAIVGKADLVDCVRPEAVPVDQYSWAMGPWCFVFERVVALSKPFAMRGSLGLFSVDPRDELKIVASERFLQS